MTNALKYIFLTLIILTVLTDGGNAHQAFRIIAQGDDGVDQEPPLVVPTPAYADDDCSILTSPDGLSYYALPTRLSRLPSVSGSLFGLSLESEAQDHLVVFLVHGLDTDRVQHCISTFAKDSGTSIDNISLYPLSLVDVSLISDPEDYPSLKFYFSHTIITSQSPQLLILTVLQSSSRRNVTAIKDGLKLQMSSTASARIRIQNPDSTVSYMTVTLPLDLGHIGLSSQGL